MAVEQDWAAYADQTYLATNDTVLARTNTGAGVEVPGSALFARRFLGGPYLAEGDAQIDGAAIVGTAAQGFGRMTSAGSAVYIQAGTLNTSGGSPNPIIFSNMYGGAGGPVHPLGDNVQALGLGSFRWSTIYAGTGTINTSDEREKTWRGAMTAAELVAAKRIAGELGFYQWNDAIAEKGADEARYHFGVRAQAVWAIMADEGLVDPIDEDGKPGDTPYAFLCYDEWQQSAAVLDRDDNVIAPERPAGSKFGLRLDQLSLFLIAAQEARLAALEAAA